MNQERPTKENAYAIEEFGMNSGRVYTTVPKEGLVSLRDQRDPPLLHYCLPLASFCMMNLRGFGSLRGSYSPALKS